MKMKHKLTISIIAALAGALLLSYPALALEDNSINVCVSGDDNILIDRILRNVLEKIGYEVNITSQNGLSAIVGAEEGQFDALAFQIDGLEEQYEHLIKVPEVLGEISYGVYAEKDSQISISSWRDLKGLTVGIEYRRPYTYARNQMSDAEGIIIQEYKNKEEIFEELRNGQLDAAVFPIVLGTPIYLPGDMEMCGIADSQENYTYLNEKHAELVPLLAAEYRKMKRNGDIDDIVGNTVSGNDGKRLVLNISSYNNDVKAEDELNMGIFTSLEQYEDTELYNISLNTNMRENHEIRTKMFADMLRADFETVSPDVIIVTDSYALDFIKEYYFKFFNDIPVIIIGVEGAEYAGFGENVIFIEKRIAAKETVDEALRLFPGTREIYVINDRLKDGLAWETIIRKELQDMTAVNIRYSGEQSFDDLLAEIRSLPKDTVILSGTYYGGNSRKYYSGKEIQKLFVQAYAVPVFSCNRTGFGEGELGGKYINKEEIGKYVGELAVKLANGAAVSEITVDPERIQNTWFFDYEQMQKWNININDLPAESQVINKSLTLKERNPAAYNMAIIAAAAGIVTIIILGISVLEARKKNAKLEGLQKNLVEAEQVIEKDRIIGRVKDKLETIIATAPLVYAVTDAAGIILETNRYAIERIGIQPGDNILDYDTDVAFRNMRIEMLREKGSLNGGIISCTLPGGTIERFYTNISAYDDLGEKRYIIWAINVEELQLQRDAYRRSQRDMKQMVDSLPWPMCIISPNDDVSIYYGNVAFKDCFRFEVEAVEECCMWRIIPEYQSTGEASKDIIHKFIKRIMESQSSVMEDMEYILSDGAKILMKAIGTEIDYNGKPSISVVLQDISAQKKEEELLISLAQKEREANDLKSKFIINMSHEIRTPLNAIIGLSDIQLQKMPGGEVQDFLEKISSAAKLLLAIVNDILDYSKIEADKMSIEKDEFLLEDVIYQAMLTAFERIGDKKVEMLLRLGQGVPKRVIGDAIRIWQIMQNVLDNSAKYTDRGSIMLDIFAEDMEPGRKVIYFRIADTGRGMSRKELDKIYEPFERLDISQLSTTGTGLGLPITKKLVEIMEGDIRIESMKGQGTITEIRIPFEVPEQDEFIIDAQNYPVIKDKKILVMDNSIEGTEILGELLKQVNAVAAQAAEVQEVIGEIGKCREVGEEYDVIVLDAGMDPAALQIIQDYQLEKTRLLMLPKPYKPSMILDKICTLLGEDSLMTRLKNNKYHFPKAKILVCEDNPINQDVISGVLGLYGIQAVVSVNGKEGIDWLERERFDLVIMDIMMPVMDGHEATKRIRNSDKPYHDIPIIAMTANAMKEEMTRCLEEGMSGYVTKPIELERIYRELLKWLPESVRVEVTENMEKKQIEEDIKKTETGEVKETMEEELKKLGIDVDSAIIRFGSKYDIYQKSLTKFAADIVENGMRDLEINTEEDWEEIRRYIHGLKGVTANLSMIQDNRLIQEFEKEIKQKNADDKLYKQLCVHMMETAKAVLSILGANKTSEKEWGNEEECAALLTQLKDYLIKAKARECEQIIGQLREKSWKNMNEELVNKVCKAVDEYDYAYALELLEQMSL